MKFAVSVGDINGIGLEVFFKSILKQNFNSHFDIYCESSSLNYYLDAISIEIPNLEAGNQIRINGNTVEIKETKTGYESHFGKISKQSGLLAAESLSLAYQSVKNTENDILLTLPIQKESMYLAGWQFKGHTEYLAKNCNVDNHLMLLGYKNLKVALATVHIPIKSVPKSIDQNKIIQTSTLLKISLLNDFGITNPKIAILGLNPHASENGNIGQEDIDIIHPAIMKLKLEGNNIYGPFPADGFFAFKKYRLYDAIIAMYHDQGLIPLKLLANGNGYNFTLGLPIIRISPDHGTAMDIAGKDKALPESMIEAINTGILVHNNRERRKNV